MVRRLSLDIDDIYSVLFQYMLSGEMGGQSLPQRSRRVELAHPPLNRISYSMPNGLVYVHCLLSVVYPLLKFNCIQSILILPRVQLSQ